MFLCTWHWYVWTLDWVEDVLYRFDSKGFYWTNGVHVTKYAIDRWTARPMSDAHDRPLLYNPHPDQSHCWLTPCVVIPKANRLTIMLPLISTWSIVSYTVKMHILVAKSIITTDVENYTHYWEIHNVTVTKLCVVITVYLVCYILMIRRWSSTPTKVLFVLCLTLPGIHYWPFFGHLIQRWCHVFFNPNSFALRPLTRNNFIN